MKMPWLVFEQAIRVTSEAAARDARADLQAQAHLGWQITTTIVAANAGKGYHPPAFDQYLRRLGLGEKTDATRARIRAEKEHGATASERVRAAFKAHGVRKQTA